jgi:hypothetical protein
VTHFKVFEEADTASISLHSIPNLDETAFGAEKSRCVKSQTIIAIARKNEEVRFHHVTLRNIGSWRCVPARIYLNEEDKPPQRHDLQLFSTYSPAFQFQIHCHCPIHRRLLHRRLLPHIAESHGRLGEEIPAMLLFDECNVTLRLVLDVWG